MSSVKKIIKVGRKVKQVGVEDNKKDTKCCSKCKKDLKYNEFTKDIYTITRFNYNCKNCISNKTKSNTVKRLELRVKEQKNEAEQWKIIPSFQKYEASTLGNIRNIKTKLILVKSLDMGGYHCCSLSNLNGDRINIKYHRIIAETFIPNPELKKTVNHKSKEKTDNRVCNLEWATSKEQAIHMRTFNPPIYKVKTVEISLDDLPNEIWKPVNGFNRYFISNMGRLKYYKFIRDKKIYNENDKMIITMGVLMAGYLASRITNGKDNKETFRIHRLVASEFLTNPENLPFVNHKDGCKTNNKLDNLEYISPSDNVKHAYDTGLYKKGGKIAIYQLDNYFKIIKEYDSISTAKKELKFGNSLSDILQGQGKSCKGFFWCYKKTYNIELDKFNKNYMVKVNQLNKKAKKIIKKWDNIIDAAKSFSDNIIIIYNILESIKTQKLSNGFRWQYAE